jgi:transcriptional regulator of acetoin/glycerol metabolism
LAQGDTIQGGDMNLRTRTAAQRLEDLSLEQVEALLIRKAMARYEGNVSRAASALGLSRSALYRRLDRYNIK